MNGMTVAADPLTYYAFDTQLPAAGFCESQVFGAGSLIAEPFNMAFALVPLALGIIALFRPQRTTVIFRILYSLLAGWGLFSAVYHVKLANGFYRMMDVSISFLQAFVVLMLFHCLAVYRSLRASSGEATQQTSTWAQVPLLLFSLYPAVVHVAGESSASPWVAWLVFDLLWGLIVWLLILIWRRRQTWPATARVQQGFRLAWMAIAYCAVAYAAWCVDEFVCSPSKPALAYLMLHGIWYAFMGLCFYALINLCRLLLACEQGLSPVLVRVPRGGPVGIWFVEWTKP